MIFGLLRQCKKTITSTSKPFLFTLVLIFLLHASAQIFIPLIFPGRWTFTNINPVSLQVYTANIPMIQNSTNYSTPANGAEQISGNISGAYSLTQSGIGKLILSGNNSYSGGTIVSGGSLEISTGGGTNSLGSGAVNLTGGNLILKLNNSLVAFGTASDYVIKSSGYTPTFTGTTLNLTSNAGNISTQVWYKNMISLVSPIAVSYVFQRGNATSTPADGSCFVFQNSTNGTNATGAPGGGIGYTGIGNSAAICIDLYNGASGSSRWGIGTLGTLPGSYTGFTNFNNQNPIVIAVSYNPFNNLLSALARDTVTNATSSISATVNLQTTVGASGYIGFTGGTGGSSALMKIINFRYTNGEVFQTISGSRGVEMNGGTTMFMNANTFTGGITVKAGTLLCANQMCFGSGAITCGSTCTTATPCYINKNYFTPANTFPTNTTSCVVTAQ